MSMKYALLGMLAESPKYGYEIKQTFGKILGNVWSVSYGQLYPTLRRLSEVKWVTKKSARGKKASEKTIYSITDIGRRKLKEWLKTPFRSNYNVKDEFTLKFLFFNSLPRKQVLDYMQEQKQNTLEQLESFQKAINLCSANADYFVKAIIRKGIIHLEAEVRWIESVVDDVAH